VLTPWSRVLVEKLAGFYLVKKFSAFYGTRRLIAAFTSARCPIPSHFVTRYILTMSSWHIAQLPSWSTTFCRLSATDSVYSQLPSIMEAVPPSATRGCAAVVKRTTGTHLSRSLQVITFTRCFFMARHPQWA